MEHRTIAITRSILTISAEGNPQVSCKFAQFLLKESCHFFSLVRNFFSNSRKLKSANVELLVSRASVQR